MAEQLKQVVALPSHEGADHHEKDHRDHDRDEYRLEVRRTDGDLAETQRVDEQRVEGAQKYRRGSHCQQDVIDQQHGLARHGVELASAAERRCPPGEEQQRDADHEYQQGEDVHAASRVGCEGVYRGEHAGAHQEGAEQREREGRNRKQYGPALERTSFFGDCERVDQCGAHQPGHEGGVLDRIPEPPAAPPEFVVGPSGADGDAQGEENPRHGGPRTRPARPGGVEATGDERRNGEGEGHRKTDVAHVEQRRVDDHAGVLQQRIEVHALGRAGQQALEGVRGNQHEGVKADTDAAEHSQHAGQHHVRQLAREDRDGKGPQRENQPPQQQRALVAAPHRGDLVVERQGTVRVAGNVLDREIIGHEGPGQRRKGDRHEHELALGSGPGYRHQRHSITLRAHQRHDGLDEGYAKRED